MFSSFSIKNFRVYWIGMFVSFCGTWVQSVAQSWLVFELSHSAFLLGIVGFFSSLPIFLFSLFSGVLADRINKKKLLIFTQTAFMVLAFLLAIFTQAKIVTVNFIMLIALLNGIVFSLDAPARQAIVVELVGKQNILNAVALNSAGFHLARILGPILAGMFIAVINIAGCFYINAITFLVFIIALLLIKPERILNNHNSHFLDDLKAGLRFIKENQSYLILISIVGVISLFGFSYIVLMPVFAKSILNLDAKGFGLLMSASGIGALLAAIKLASLKGAKERSRNLVFSLYIFSLALIILSLSKSFVFSMLILVLIGFSSLSALAIINSMIQEKVPDEFRGRIMSIYILTFAGTIPFGSLISGSLSQIVGADLSLLIAGLICFLLLIFFRKFINKGLVLA